MGGPEMEVPELKLTRRTCALTYLKTAFNSSPKFDIESDSKADEARGSSQFDWEGRSYKIKHIYYHLFVCVNVALT